MVRAGAGAGDFRNGFPSLELSYKQLMTHSPRRNPAELRASRHRVARAILPVDFGVGQ